MQAAINHWIMSTLLNDCTVKYRVAWRLAAAVAIWICSMASGFALWENYDRTTGTTPDSINTESKLKLTSEWELTLYAHPHCSCTQATLVELATLAERAGPRLAIRVVFFVPDGASDQWADGSNRTTAGKLPGAVIAFDRGGAYEISRAGARTSGTVILRNADGQVKFQGGLTRSRGQFGESAGKRAILDHMNNNITNVSKTPVYGCSLLDFN